MVKQRLISHFKIWLGLAIGGLLALTLCVQCIGTYIYADAVLVPQQAQREAERQASAFSTILRNAGTTNPRALGPTINHALASASDRILWTRILDSEGNALAQGGTPGPQLTIPPDWREKLKSHETVAVPQDNGNSKAIITILPFRMPRPARAFNRRVLSFDQHTNLVDPHALFLIEMAIPLKGVTGEFDELRKHLIVGMLASLALLISVGIIGLRIPQYLRGKHLERELEMAQWVQRDLQPKPHSLSSNIALAALAVSAGEVGGDFYDIFEASPGKTAIVLGDVSGKGVSAALLMSVLQGAIRSSTSSQHELACERVNRMLYELTAQARFASLFWGIFDPTSGILRYVNAGHEAPMLIRRGPERIVRLDCGGPVLGLLPFAQYSAGSVRIGASDTLLIYSDGISEAANKDEEEFGEDRLKDIISQTLELTSSELCEEIMTRVSIFASAGPTPDDRSLLVVEFRPTWSTCSQMASEDLLEAAVD